MLDASAIAKIAELAQQAKTPAVSSFGGYEWTDKPITRINTDPAFPSPLVFQGLGGFVDYLKLEPQAAKALIHIEGPSLVVALSPLTGRDVDHRLSYATAKAELGDGFVFDEYGSLQDVNIALQVRFEPVGDLEQLRKFCASVRGAGERTVSDDGVSQEVQAKAGIASIANVPVKNPWMLAPYRTFAEVRQPLSPYVLRFKQDDDELEAALFATDDRLWRVAAVQAIAAWLRDRLPESLAQRVLG